MQKRPNPLQSKVKGGMNSFKTRCSERGVPYFDGVNFLTLVNILLFNVCRRQEEGASVERGPLGLVRLQLPFFTSLGHSESSISSRANMALYILCLDYTCMQTLSPFDHTHQRFSQFGLNRENSPLEMYALYCTCARVLKCVFHEVRVVLGCESLKITKIYTSKGRRNLTINFVFSNFLMINFLTPPSNKLHICIGMSDTCI